MARFCDVAVPVPLDAAFTYSNPEEMSEPCVGGRVIVPFREKRLCGIVTELHDREPKFEAKPLLQVLDTAAALTPELMQLGRWITHYYIAPIGEVLRTMRSSAALSDMASPTRGWKRCTPRRLSDRRCARGRSRSSRCWSMPCSTVLLMAK